MKAFKIIFIFVCLLSGGGLAASGQTRPAPRERSSFNADWRFQKGDPAGAEGRLAYDKIKPWLMATGNEFVAAAAQVKRPAGDLGSDISYAQPSFDDSGWRRLNLPHDWGLEGPFDQNLRGLASLGIENISLCQRATAAGKSISMLLARWLTLQSGSTASSSAAGPMAMPLGSLI